MILKKSMRHKRFVSKSGLEFYIGLPIDPGYVQICSNEKLPAVVDVDDNAIIPIKDIVEFMEWYHKQLRLIT